MYSISIQYTKYCSQNVVITIHYIHYYNKWLISKVTRFINISKFGVRGNTDWWGIIAPRPYGSYGPGT